MGKARICTLRAMYLKQENGIYYALPIPVLIDIQNQQNWDKYVKFPTNSDLGEMVKENSEDIVFVRNDKYGLILVSSFDVSREFR